MAVTPDGAHAYVTNSGDGNRQTSIHTATNQVTATIHGLCSPAGVAVSPGGTHIYVTNGMIRGTVSVITRG